MIHSYRFELESAPNLSIIIDATCYTKAIQQFCLVFGDFLAISCVSCIVKLN